MSQGHLCSKMKLGRCALRILFIISLCIYSCVSQIEKPEPDCDYNITQLIESKGYPCEEHKVITPDGYILGVFRIPHGRNSTTLGRPILLQHGLLDAATTWVLNFPEQSLGFILADIGYDVWLGNIRGNRYSRAHTKYNPDHDEAFWDFSWDEMASIDLPSMIYYILNVTKYEKLAYIGHSQGTLIGFAEFGNMYHPVQHNVSFYAALAPIAQIGHQKTPLKVFDTDTKELERYWHRLFGRNEFLPASNILKWLGEHACAEFVIDHVICENLLFIVGGPDTKNMNSSRIPVYVAHGPSGTSVKNMIHFMQCGHSDRFQAYNYETPEQNQLHYNQTFAPIYSIRDMKVPTAVFWAGEDWLADPQDVTYVFDNLGSLVYEKYLPIYNHFDFVWALSAREMIYNDLINIMQIYHPIH